MEITRRDIAILTGFCVLLAVGVTLVVRRATAPPAPADEPTPRARTASSEPTEPVRPASALLGSALAAGEVPSGARVIVERNLFRPLVQVAARGATRSTEPKLGDIPRVDAPVQEPIKSVNQPGGQPEQRPERPPGETPITPPPTPTASVAVTGLMGFGDGFRVVLEHKEKRQTRIVKVGDEAFGYRVTAINEDDREVRLTDLNRPGGESIMLKLGQGKTVEEKKDQPPTPTTTTTTEQRSESSSNSSSSSSSSRSYGGPPGFDPSRLSPEQRARFEEWRSRRGDRGGFRGN